MNKPPWPLAGGYGQIQIQSPHGNSGESENKPVAELLDSKDVAAFKEFPMANTIQVDTMYQLLIQNGYFSEAEFMAKMKEVGWIISRVGIKALGYQNTQ